MFEFAKEAKIELRKVVWPTRQETIQTTSIVMVMVAVTGFILWGIDSGMMWIIAKINTFRLIIRWKSRNQNNGMWFMPIQDMKILLCVKLNLAQSIII